MYPVHFEGESISKKDFLFAMGKYLQITDNKCNNKSIKKLNQGIAYDLKQISDGVYSYFLSGNTLLNGFAQTNGFVQCGWVNIVDEHLNDIKSNITLKKFGSIPEDNYPAQYHDHLILNENHYFLLGYTSKIINDIPIANCIIQEQLNDKVIWQFETADYPELYEYSFFHKIPEGEKLADYAHMNSICLTDDNKSLLISLRNIGILKVDYATKDIIWFFGKNYTNLDLNGLITLDKIFSKQHDIRLTGPNSFTIFNNKYNFKEQDSPIDLPSSVCEITIEDKKIIKYNEYLTDYWSGAMGCAIKISDDVYDIGYGARMLNKKTFFKWIGLEEINIKTGEQYLIGHPMLLYRFNRGL